MPLPAPLNSLMRAIPALPRGPVAMPPQPQPPSPAGGLENRVFADVLNKRLGESSSADPRFVLKQLQQSKIGISQMIPHTAFRLPEVDKHLTRALTALDQAIKAAEAAQAQSSMSGGPIDMSAAVSGAGVGGGPVPGGIPGGLGVV